MPWLQHTNNNYDLNDEAIEKNRAHREKNLWFFLDYPLQKIVRFCASERSILAPDNNR
jgi:hypothetical protein